MKDATNEWKWVKGTQELCTTFFQLPLTLLIYKNKKFPKLLIKKCWVVEDYDWKQEKFIQIDVRVTLDL